MVLALLTASTFVTVAREQTFELLHSFQNLDGATPYVGLMQGTNGNFYGTTFFGGTNNYGTVFKMTTNGALTTLVTFSNTSNGAYPEAALVQGSDGNFYGTTDSGGTGGAGTLFKMTATGTLTNLVKFINSNGGYPLGRLLQGRDGNFYSTTYYGGTNGVGIAFKMTTNGALTTLVTFNTNNGAFPLARLVQGSNDNFYGTTYQGGTSNLGTVFQMTTNGSLTTLVGFNGTNGANPGAGLIQWSDGNFYGTTRFGGTNNYGTVFKMTTNGTLTTLASFDYSGNGANPRGGLVQGSDGNFYGTTSQGGAYGYGTVFQMTPAGTLATLVTFDNNNGAFPWDGVVQAADRGFYGTTSAGGTNGYGTIFRIFMPVSLSASPSGNKVVLSWSTNFAFGYTLQTTPNLTPPLTWTDSTNIPVIVGSQFTVTNITSGSGQFYRLKK